MNQRRTLAGTKRLERLWRAQIKSVLGQFLAETTDYREVASLASHIGADYKGRFLIELIQNAEDQSVVSESLEADHRGARLVIVRTKKLLVIINEGRSFSAKGIKSITSLGLSAKDPEHNLGNKGVGFKAVFEVTDGPEIYSAPESGGSIWDDGATRLRLETDPFSDDYFRKRIKELIKEVVDADPQLRALLTQFVGTEDYSSILLTELKQAAPFKFPKPVDCELLTGYLDELGLSKKTLESAATVVVLPLLQGESALAALEQSLDELTGTVYPANVLLFLEGIDKLWIIDRVKEAKWLMRRKLVDTYKALPRGAKLQRISTQLSNRSNSPHGTNCAEWWLARRKIGRDGDDPKTVSLEEKQISQAVANLEIANWRDVCSAHAAIALPRPYPEGAQLAQLGSIGKFCIGLPTLVDTGLPAWVDGPFHGKISRTEIDFDAQDYNSIILNEAKELFWNILERMKEIEDIAVRREVLLNLEIGRGKFASAIQENILLEEREIILDFYGTTFLKPVAIAIPDAEDINLFFQLIVPVVDPAEYGFILPDQVLLTRCRTVLENLSGGSQIVVSMQAYYQKPDSRRSLLEDVAQKHRNHGREYWEPLLRWVTDRFSFEDLKDQRILPVGSIDLAAAEDRVFFSPLTANPQPGESDDGSEEAEGYSDEVVDDLNASFLEDLSFIDENCIQVRQKSRSRRLTILARKLSPEQGAVLVRSPRRPELINEVLAPFLQRICSAPDLQNKALAVLAQISDWLIDMGEAAKIAVRLDAVLIPSLGEDGNWIWRASGNMYFGSSWLDADTGTLLENAYGQREGARLLPWEIFTGAVGADVDRAVWRMRFLALGVLDKPRLIHNRRSRRSYLKAGWNYRISIDDSNDFPIEQARPYWKTYLQRLSDRPTEVKSGQPYYIRYPIWVDGLELEGSRNAIAKLMLRNAEHYTSSAEISVAREHGVDSVTFPSLWVHAIKMQQWPILPTNLGNLPPEKVWRLTDDMQRRTFVRDDLIAYVIPPYDQGSTLLSYLGVYSPSEAPVQRIVQGLQDLAESLDEFLVEKRRSTEAFIHALYAWLQESCDNEDDSSGQLANITDRPVPMIQGGQIKAVDLDSDARVLLDDDPSRSPYVIGIESFGQLPLRAGKPFKALFKSLRSVLGENRVLRASEAPIDIGFLIDLEKKEVGYLEYLLAEDTSDHQNIRRDLGALTAYGRPQQPMDPQKKEFYDTWKRLQETRLVRGSFRDQEHASAVFDPRADDGPALFIPIDYGYEQILGAGWQLVGPAHHDVWEAYVGRVRAGDSHLFFQERHITERDWDELNAVIGTSLEQQIHTFRPVLLALCRKIRPELDVESFLHELERRKSNTKVVAAWVGIELTNLQKGLQEAVLFSSDERMVDVLQSFQLDVAEWQRARQDLGLPPVVFRDAEDGFRVALAAVIAFILASVAREESSCESLNRYRELLEPLRVTPCPEVVKEQPSNEMISIQAVITTLKAMLSEEKAGMEKEFIVYCLNNLDHIQAVGELADQRIPKREINLYQHEVQSQRETGAKSAVDDILNVAKPLAATLKEIIDPEEVKLEASLVYWSMGWWANRFAALRNLRVLLKRNAPVTVAKLESVRAFHSPCRSWRDLWGKLPELGELPKDEKPIMPPRKRILLGAEIIESDFERIISQGDAGVLGQALQSAIDPNFDPRILVGRSRGQVPPPHKRKPSGNGRGGRGGGGSGKADLERIGLLGEAFVYESFSRVLPEFDSACWLSGNRNHYGLSGVGNDGLGYDFAYTDINGHLTGREVHPHCYIEVKSTSADTDIPFPMTTNEWLVAEECFKGARDALYIIVRVLEVESRPRIVDLIVDPVRLWFDGKLALSNRDFIIHNAPF